MFALPTPVWAIQLSTNTGNTHYSAPGVAAADYVNTSYLLFLALRVVTRVVTTEKGQHAIIDPSTTIFRCRVARIILIIIIMFISPNAIHDTDVLVHHILIVL